MRNTYQHALILGFCAMFVVTLSLAVAPASQAAGPWYVAPTGSDNNSCNTSTTPCLTIQGAINKSNNGDTINIATGFYTGSGNEVVSVNKSLTLLGGWNSNFSAQTGFSTIDGGKARRGVKILTGANVVLQRLIVQNGFAAGGSGVFNEGSVTMVNSVIQANVYLEYLPLPLGGGGIYNSGELTLNRVAVIKNLVNNGVGGGLMNSGTAKINNSTFSQNDASAGSGIYNAGGSLLLKSSTVHLNRSSTGGAVATSGGPIYLQNTIVAGNSGPDCVAFFDGTPGPISQGYNLIGTTASCNLTTHPTDQIGVDAKLNPYLVGLPSYHPLISGSPAINAGSPGGCLDSSGAPITTDQRGQPRDAQCDIGAYEFLTPGPIVSLEILDGTPQHTRPGAVLRLPLKLFAVDAKGTPATGAKVLFTAPSTGVSGSFSGTGSYTTTATIDAIGVVTATTFTANQLTGIYTIAATAGISVPVRMFTVGNTLGLYVSTGGSDSAYCWTPTTPCISVNKAISKAWPDDTVYVATGTYTDMDPAVIHVTKNITLTAGWEATFSTQSGRSIFDGQGVRRVLLTGAEIVNVDNVVLQNGYNPINENEAGGLHNGGILTLTNSIVTRSSSFTGVGGISNSGTLTLNRTTVMSNEGGGILNDGILIVNSSLIANNYGRFGGIYNRHASSIMNNGVIINNRTTTPFSAGGITNDSAILVVNSTSIVANYSAYSAGGIGTTGSSSSVALKNTLISDNQTWDHEQNCSGIISSQGYNLIRVLTGCDFSPLSSDKLNLDPKVVILGNVPALAMTSPAIDAGDPAGCKNHLGQLLMTDQLGRPRSLDGNADTIAVCDIGAYEASPNEPIRQLFLPVIRKPKPRIGLNGTVTQNGAPAVNVPLDLRFYNGSFWSTWTSTTTDADGDFFFTGVPSLAPGQRYYVRFQNSAGGDSSRLWTWHTRSLTSYVAGSDVAIGSFDIANIALVSPASGANVTLPRTFQWTPRPATPTDNYEFNLYDPNDFNPYFFTNPPLGYVSSYTLANLPPGFGTGPIYAWEIWVYGLDGSFGVSYETWGIYFANSGANSTADLPTGATKYDSEFESQLNLDLHPRNP